MKGVKAIGNQITTEKVKQFNVMPSLPYEKQVDDSPTHIEVEDPETVEKEDEGNSQISLEL